MDLAEVRAELEGLSEAQLKMLVELAFGGLPEDSQGLLVRLASQMRHVNEQEHKGG